MFSQLAAWLVKSNGAKVGLGAVGGSGIVALVLTLHGDMTNKIQAQDSHHKAYIALSIQPLQTEVRNLRDEQKEIKELVRDIHKYLLENK